MNIIRTVYVRVFSALAAVVLLSSCQEDVRMTQQSEHTVGFYAGGGQTRTAMLPDGLSSMWTEGDQLSLWALNSSGSYTLSNQIFKAYGLDSGRGFFTSSLSEQMPEDVYTYLACYPVPAAVSGSKVTFNLPSVQDGKASSGADIMISEPVRHGPLTAIPEPEDHSGLRVSMNHMMHQFRFFVPEDDQLLGDEKIERILLTFPKGVTGNVTLDVENPDAPVELTDAQAEVELKLSQPIGVSEGDDYQFACLAFAPVQFEQGQVLQLKAYTDDKIVFLDPIPLIDPETRKAKNCESGHSTPVKLKIKELNEFPYQIHFTIEANNLGESVNSITFTAPEGCQWQDSGSNVYTYALGNKINTGEKISFYFDYTQADLYRGFSGKKISISYNSDHALTYQTVTIDDLATTDITNVSIAVPYLFYEDFSNLKVFDGDYTDGPYTTVGNASKAGRDLSQYGLPYGWSGARTGCNAAGTSILVAGRVDCVIAGATRAYGRLESPVMSALKPGATVNLKVAFDYSGARLNGNDRYYPVAQFGCVYDSSNDVLFAGYATQFNNSAAFTVIGSAVEVPSVPTNGNASAMTGTVTHTLTDCSTTTRLSWHVGNLGYKSWKIENGYSALYVDNVRVQIAK